MARLGFDTIVHSVSTLSGLTKKECRAVLTDFMYVVRNALLNGMEVEMKGIGLFGLKYRPPKEPRLMPNVAQGGAMTWTKPKEEYNYPIFTVYKSVAKKVRDVTEGNAFKPKDDKKYGVDMTLEEYDEFSKRLDELNFDSPDFDDEDFLGQPSVEREFDYGTDRR